MAIQVYTYLLDVVVIVLSAVLLVVIVLTVVVVIFSTLGTDPILVVALLES